jgi:hypothetical protein
MFKLHRRQLQQVKATIQARDGVDLGDELVLGEVELHHRPHWLQVIGVGGYQRV